MRMAIALYERPKKKAPGPCREPEIAKDLSE